MPQEPKSAHYDGFLYALFLDPQLAGLRGFIARQIPEGSRVLDAGCGTGSLVFRLAPHCQEVLGIDLSPRMIQYANGICRKRGFKNVRFEVQDVAHLNDIEDGAFDYATLVMALHEIPCEVRSGVIPELVRVAKKVLAIDYAVPMRWNLRGLRNRLYEVLAGPRHFSAFRDYDKRGGLPSLIQAAEVSILKKGLFDEGNLTIHTLFSD